MGCENLERVIFRVVKWLNICQVSIHTRSGVTRVKMFLPAYLHTQSSRLSIICSRLCKLVVNQQDETQRPKNNTLMDCFCSERYLSAAITVIRERKQYAQMCQLHCSKTWGQSMTIIGLRVDTRENYSTMLEFFYCHHIYFCMFSVCHWFVGVVVQWEQLWRALWRCWRHGCSPRALPLDRSSRSNWEP